MAILATDGAERVELEQPSQALEDAGARTYVVSITSGEILARNQDLEDAGSFGVDRLVLSGLSVPGSDPDGSVPAGCAAPCAPPASKLR